MSNPAARNYEASQLYDRLAALEERCARLERAPRAYIERAKITTVGGGMVVVTYPSGTTRTIPYDPAGYSPAVNDQVWVLNSPNWSGVGGKVTS